jgi:hypothetical protein
MSEATDGKISLCANKFLATIRYSETEGQVFSMSDRMIDGFGYTFVKKQ